MAKQIKGKIPNWYINRNFTDWIFFSKSGMMALSQVLKYRGNRVSRMIDYRKMTEWAGGNPILKKAIVILGKTLPVLVMALYGATAIFLLVRGSHKLLLFLAVPALCLIAVTVLRPLINRVRPYDRLGYPPLLNKESGKGKSFPSRHTASAFVVAAACLYLNPVYGRVMLVLAVLIGATRVLSGVHYLSDVLAGAGFALLCTLFFFLPV